MLMLCKVCDVQYIGITISILDIIRRLDFYLKTHVSGTKFFPSLQVKPTDLGPIDRDK
jgi:hypothetical protein